MKKNEYCINCGKELTGKKSKYCSYECQLLKIGRLSTPRYVLCVICKRPILSRRGTSKYCSGSCRYENQKGKYKKDFIEAIKRQKKYAEKHPEKVKAQKLLQYAVMRGNVLKSDYCEMCSVYCKTHGHHSDYSKPYDVLWLCPKCHKGIHVNNSLSPA